MLSLVMKIRPSIYSMFCPPPTTTLRGSPKSVVSLSLLFKAHFKVSAASARVMKSGSLKPWRRSSLRRPRYNDHYRHWTTAFHCIETCPPKISKRRIRIINGKNTGERTRALSAIRSVASDSEVILSSSSSYLSTAAYSVFGVTILLCHDFLGISFLFLFLIIWTWDCIIRRIASAVVAQLYLVSCFSIYTERSSIS